jgi:O-antigen ligase
MLLLGMPMVWAIGADPKAGAARKFMMSGTLALMAAMVLRSGSREGLLGLAILGLIAFVRRSARGKVAIVAGAMLFSIAAIGFLPRGLKARFGTLFGNSGAEAREAQTEEEHLLVSAAAGSAETRWDLLVTSLQVTVRHPLLGVGPGNFAPYTAEQAKANGRHGYWVGTHNTYTQISSEAGIPALCIYLAILGTSITGLRRIHRRAAGIPGDAARSIANMALALQTSFIAFAILCPFNHMAYEPAMPLLAALVVAMSRTAPNELSRIENAGASAEAGPASATSPSTRANPAGAAPRRVRAASAGC